MKKYGRRNNFWLSCVEAGIEDPEKWIKDEYLSGLSCGAIVEKLFVKEGIKVSVKNINDYVRKMGIARSLSEAKRMAMKTGRMVYKKKKKRDVKYLSDSDRMAVMQRDGFKCALCGAGREDGVKLHVYSKDPAEGCFDTLCTRCVDGLSGK